MLLCFFRMHLMMIAENLCDNNCGVVHFTVCGFGRTFFISERKKKHMKSTLENVWNQLAAPEPLPWNTEQKKELSDVLDEKQNALVSLLVEEQKNALHEYNYSMLELSSLYETEAFIKGVRFGVSLMLEVLPNK